jgi:hypothetical protein
MRSVPLACSLVLTLIFASGASAAPRYSAARTRPCLVAAGARIDSGRDQPVTLNYPEITQQFLWDFRVPNATEGEIVMFTANAASAKHLMRRLVRLSYSLGATMAEARRMVGTNGNAVWLSDVPKLAPLSAKRTALLQRCLR